MPTWETEVQPGIEKYSGLSNKKVHFFHMNNKMYLMDGENFLQYDGTTVSEVNPYIPTLSISRDPNGGGSPNEDFNLLGRGFKDSFSGDGTATVFQLSLKGLDTNTVKAEVDNATINEGSGLTVNRTNGTVTFTTAPSKGTNNIIITAYKTYSDFPNRVKKNRFSVLFGGSNDTRVFLSGNPDFPNRMIRSGLNDPSYWPENGFYNIGSDFDKIQGFVKQYDYLVIEKERSKWMMQFQLNDGDVSFPTKPINDQVGTYASETIQLIENNPVSVSKKGVYTLVTSGVRDERNVQHISEKVDAKLLREKNLDKAISIDYDRKYWIAVNGNVYVYDYSINEWYIYNNVNANQFYVLEDHLYFGSNTEGLIFYFDRRSFSDDGSPIHAYWYSKLFNFGRPEYQKLVEKIFISMKPLAKTSLNLYVRTDKTGETHLLTKRMDKFDFNSIDFERFTFITSDIPQTATKKVKLKKITDIQIKVDNNEVNEGLGVLSNGLKYSITNEVR